MLVYSWDGNAQINDGTNFAAWFVGQELGLPKLDVNMVPRTSAHPLIGGLTRQGLEVMMEVEVLAGSADTLRAWFDNEDQTPKLFVVVDEGGANARYWRAICSEFMPTSTPYIYLVKLRVHGDVRLRSVTPTSQHWDITTSGATTSVNNGTAGINDDAYPIITVTPQSFATGANSYRRFVTVRWRNDAAANVYPVDIVAGGLDTRIASTHFASAAGNDIRVIVDGVEANYWLYNVNTATTKVFVNLDWQPKRETTLATAMGSGTITSITVGNDVTNFPAAGILEIDSELFTYSGKDNAARRFSDVRRAEKGTTAATHSAGATVRWVQHDIWIEYGSATLPAPVIDDSRKPVFNLATSSNTSWDYDEFAIERVGGSFTAAGGWTFVNNKNMKRYGGDHASWANPYVELGIEDDCAYQASQTAIEAYWSLFNPCGIVSANFQNGEYYYSRNGWTTIRIRSSGDGGGYTVNYTIPVATRDAWTAWSQNVTLVTGARYLQLYMTGFAKNIKSTRVEVADVTVTLDSAGTPTVVIGAEQTTYRLQGTLTNVTTGDAIEIDFGMDLGQSLEINTDTEEVTLLADGSPQYQALTIVGGSRKSMMRLQPGANTLKYEESGLVDVDVDVEFERRFRV